MASEVAPTQQVTVEIIWWKVPLRLWPYWLTGFLILSFLMAIQVIPPFFWLLMVIGFVPLAGWSGVMAILSCRIALDEQGILRSVPSYDAAAGDFKRERVKWEEIVSFWRMPLWPMWKVVARPSRRMFIVPDRSIVRNREAFETIIRKHLPSGPFPWKP